ncbi:hypothetical protein Tco_0569957, partial [Tanacetum coccineum]
GAWSGGVPAVMVVAGMTAAAGGYEVEGGDVDDGGVGGGDGGVCCGGTAAGEEGEGKMMRCVRPGACGLPEVGEAE